MFKKHHIQDNAIFQCCSSRPEPLIGVTDISTRSQHLKKSLKNKTSRKQPLDKQKQCLFPQEFTTNSWSLRQSTKTRPQIYFSYKKYNTEHKVAPLQSSISQTYQIKNEINKREESAQSLANNSLASSSTQIQFDLPSCESECEYYRKDLNLEQKPSHSFRYIDEYVSEEQRQAKGVFGDIKITKIKSYEEEPFSPPSNQWNQNNGKHYINNLESIKKESQMPSTTIENSIKQTFRDQIKCAKKMIYSDKTHQTVFQRGSLFSKVRNAQTLCLTLTSMSDDLQTSNVIENFQGLLSKYKDKKLTDTQLEAVSQHD